MPTTALPLHKTEMPVSKIGPSSKYEIQKKITNIFNELNQPLSEATKALLETKSNLALPEEVRLNDVTDRDGVQTINNTAGKEILSEINNAKKTEKKEALTELQKALQKITVPIEQKKELCQRLRQCGFSDIELTGLLHPNTFQLRDAKDLLTWLGENPSLGNSHSIIIPNNRGVERLREILSQDNPPRINKIATLCSASKKFAEDNLKTTIESSISMSSDVLDFIKSHNQKQDTNKQIGSRAYLSACFKYKDEQVSKETVKNYCQELLGKGFDKVVICDSSGDVEPEEFIELLEYLSSEGIPTNKLAIHLHNDPHNGKALENMMIALIFGIQEFDTSLADSGGCTEFTKEDGSKGGPPNSSTEMLSYLLSKLNIKIKTLLGSINPKDKFGEIIKASNYMHSTILARTEPNKYAKLLGSLHQAQDSKAC